MNETLVWPQRHIDTFQHRFNTIIFFCLGLFGQCFCCFIVWHMATGVQPIKLSYLLMIPVFIFGFGYFFLIGLSSLNRNAHSLVLGDVTMTYSPAIDLSRMAFVLGRNAFGALAGIRRFKAPMRMLRLEKLDEIEQLVEINFYGKTIVVDSSGDHKRWKEILQFINNAGIGKL